MDEGKYKDAVLSAVRRNPRHPPEAYDFINGAVSYAVSRHVAEKRDSSPRHVRGSELIRRVLEFAVSKYSFMAPSVFRYWDIRSGLDIGHMVFAMIRCGILSASEEDSINDFDCVPDIRGALEQIIGETER